MKTIIPRRDLLSGLILAPLAMIAAPARAKPRRHNYAVIFKVVFDDSGKLVDISVSKVIDPLSGTTAGLNIPVPDVFIAKVRAKVEARPLESNQPGTFYITNFFNPDWPDNIDVGP